jgi:hypothetical protein
VLAVCVSVAIGGLVPAVAGSSCRWHPLCSATWCGCHSLPRVVRQVVCIAITGAGPADGCAGSLLHSGAACQAVHVVPCWHIYDCSKHSCKQCSVVYHLVCNKDHCVDYSLSQLARTMHKGSPHLCCNTQAASWTGLPPMICNRM